jgi:5-methyltetrahydropteroyltriglutamate--homocysteine methyltransferase
MSHSFPAATILGYPRIGPKRELKKSVETFWSDAIDVDALEAAAASLRADTRARLVSLGLSADDASVPSDFSYYDQVLDAAVAVGAIPERFADLADANGVVDLAGYFTIARGEGSRPPLEMTKWFDSNYHYLVPEIGPDTAFHLACRRVIDEFVEAKEAGVLTRPVIVGPVTFLLLSKPAEGSPDDFWPLQRINDLSAVYVDLLRELAAAGATWVQIDEPALVVDTWPQSRAQVREAVESAYTAITQQLTPPDRPAVLVALAYGSASDLFGALRNVEAVALDLDRGEVPNADELAQLDATTIVGGVVSGRNVWRSDLDAALSKLEALRAAAPEGTQIVAGTSTSLFHVPYDASLETAMPEDLRSWLAFADQKVDEVHTLAEGLADRASIAAQLAESARIRANRFAHPGVRRADVRDAVAGIDAADFSRIPYAERAEAQRARFDLPLLPTTTIGSFPQTAEIRRARAAHRRGDLSEADYTAAMQAEIAAVVAAQEELGLDVLVHGEAERNDMVQYFAELLDGFTDTEHGWVQSYGSRATRPAILWGDVARPEPMTVRWITYANSLSAKPVKGMLTGPVTILAWSFVRDDQPLGETANQIALALRQEITDLEAAGVGIVQVDEPALRELLPLRRENQAAYLDWAVNAFRLATGGAGPATQIHTHMCYSEFGEIFDAIDALDADVTSIEAARSKMELLSSIKDAGFERGIGPGVYDIHSPRVPSQDEIEELLRAALASVGTRQLWVNPDCGLKTRGWAEVTPSLANLVAAAAVVRAEQ